MVIALIIFVATSVLEGVILLVVFVRWNRRDNLWTPYLQRSYEFRDDGKIEFGLKRRGDRLIVEYVAANSDDLSGDLAKAESDLRERAILLNSSTKELAR